MAKGILYICNSCGHEIEAWDEGKPYYIDKAGQKQYAYHPDERREWCIGIDSPHLCLGCGKKFDVDSRSLSETCPECGENDIVDTYQLEGHKCPYCEGGVFKQDPDCIATS